MLPYNIKENNHCLAYLPHFCVRRNSSKPDFVKFRLAAILLHEVHLFGGVSDCKQRLTAPRVELSQQQFVRHRLVTFIEFFHDAGRICLKLSVIDITEQRIAPMFLTVTEDLDIVKRNHTRTKL